MIFQLDAEKIVDEDLFQDLNRIITLLFVHRIQQVENIGEHMTRAARQIADFYVLWAGDLEEITLWLLWRDVVLHLLCQP